ncbi:DUF4097 family beta strand repeat-containing protein [Salsuginibacillus kocurii]|uniref:DUF4097 family beta strand repeat-containing protein n=1 Tax=Salsuginibacillus kocurii TaxID=427078 RepID=UPI00037FD3BB|nr:DUF4097 domain-containing protein [Salsuginibacillus kocurii]
MDEERRMILKMIDDGKISAQEGERLLRALNKDEEEEKTTAASSPSPSSAVSPPLSAESEVTDAEHTTQDLSTEVNWEEGNRRFDEWKEEAQEREEAGREAPWTTGSKWLTDFFETAMQRIRDVDLDFNFGSAVTVDHTFQHRAVKERIIDISIENGSLSVEPWDQPDLRLECSAAVYRANDEESARKSFLEHAVFQADGTHVHFRSKSKALKMQATLYLPKQQYERLQFYTFNGHLQIGKLDTNALKAKIVNGSISTEGVWAEDYYAETVNGPVTVRNVDLKKSDIRTVNGEMNLKGRMSDVHGETMNGLIQYEPEQIEDTRLHFSAATGGMHITIPEQFRVDGVIRTNLGNYKLGIPDVNIVDEKKDFIQKSVQFTANEQGRAHLRLEADSKTGMVHINPAGHQ